MMNTRSKHSHMQTVVVAKGMSICRHSASSFVGFVTVFEVQKRTIFVIAKSNVLVALGVKNRQTV